MVVVRPQIDVMHQEKGTPSFDSATSISKTRAPFFIANRESFPEHSQDIRAVGRHDVRQQECPVFPHTVHFFLNGRRFGKSFCGFPFVNHIFRRARVLRQRCSQVQKTSAPEVESG